LSDQPSAYSTSSESIQGVVERLTYHSAETGYTVARFQTPKAHELITVVGNFAEIQPGQTLSLEGNWKEHPQYGSQFQVLRYRETKPATLTGIEKYLGSGLIKGVGPVTAKRIVAHFGLETLNIIEAEIDRLSEVPGIARKRVEMIKTAWASQKAIKEVMLFLQSHGVSTTYAVKIFKHYGDRAIEIVTQNPYQLATDIYGIGFITADAIARNIGIDPGSEYRYRSGILHVLNEAAEEGHCYLPQVELVERAVKQLAIVDHQPEITIVDRLVQQMPLDGELVIEKSSEPSSEVIFHCYSPPFYGAEYNLAEQILRLLGEPLVVDLPRVQRWIERFITTTGLPLSIQQQQAVELAASQRVLILTGGPGCGKTFTTRAIVGLWKAMGKRIALASPTGRAAQRLSEMTGQEAKTIHRLLEFDPRTLSFQRDRQTPIDADAIIVDEASMLDLFLANSLLKAIALDAQLLLVGDVDQLPSVGAGKVLDDLIQSAQVPVIRLTEVFRQAQASQIVRNAHLINQGNFPKLEPVSDTPQSDCLWLATPQPHEAVQAIQDLLSIFVPSLGFDPITDVQVLAPMLRGDVGTRNLNQVLQALLNPAAPDKPELQRGNLILRVGDRLIQQVNDYGRDVFNGDVGTLTAIELDEQIVTVRFGDRLVDYDYADLNELALAWSITIHKSQGSEYPVVILPFYMQHYLMLNRNLLYTGLTRAKQLAILVGDTKAIALSVNSSGNSSGNLPGKQSKARSRYTGLTKRLNGAI
jgi:exodeoxyribonuclease V alpha subunit